METLTIQRLSRRYHLKPSERDLATELDNITEHALGDPLDQALARLGFDENEAICLRHVTVRLDYDSDRSALHTGETWSDQIANAIRSTLAECGGHHDDYLVRYPSRRHGLIDFALQVSAGRLHRAWAWNQLGWSQLPDPPSQSQAHQQLVQALQREPDLLLPLFIRLAQAGRLARWLNSLLEIDQLALAHRLLTQAGMPDTWLDQTPPSPAVQANTGQPGPDSKSDVSQSTQIARHLTADPPRLTRSAIPARQWILISLLEREPALFQRPNRIVIEQLAGAEKQWRRILGDSISSINQTVNGESPRTGEPDSDLAEYPNPANDETNKTDPTGRSHSNETASDEPLTRDKDSVDRATERGNAQEGQGSHPNKPNSSRPTDNIEPNEPYPEPIDSEDEASTPWLEPTVHHSDWGGLFYLLPLLDDPPSQGQTGIARALIENSVFAQRSLSWVFYHFFRILFEQEYDSPRQASGGRWGDPDGGVRGMDAEVKPPGTGSRRPRPGHPGDRHGFPPPKEPKSPYPGTDPSLKVLTHWPVEEDTPDFESPNPDERDALDTQVYRCTQALRDRLPQLESVTGDPWPWLCQRPAQLHLDTAWIDVHFPLEKLDTDIRKAGLDLDPDYVPWLGKVVKFHYD